MSPKSSTLRENLFMPGSKRSNVTYDMRSVRTNGQHCKLLGLPCPFLQEQNFGFCPLALHIRSYALARAFDNDQFGNSPVLQTAKNLASKSMP